ncbi:hypothetical protein ABT272_40615 [Streptomyces sp900105245]|uniref:Uncharacterized protein n=1 Tax=Streptomyces sp. 900105245 TaxID=3154379 RepID=A0ABV1UJQ1_9ACTN
MDDEAVYGPVLYELDLSDAIARGLLARYQVVVAELRDPSLTPQRLYGEERESEEVRGERLAVLQAALLETMAAHGLTRCITFHHRTIEARAFAEGLGRAAKRLHAEDPGRHPERYGHPGCRVSTTRTYALTGSPSSAGGPGGPCCQTAASWARASTARRWTRSR